jgi:7,8-dihydropterin-6-yl-methyl-4-(beta-D-ribofuranosyl)aminobenzene 5'-phosphate synthase
MLRITILSENTAGMGDFLAEWGLSVLIETDTATILLDTGTSISALHNAVSMGIDLTKIDKIVLSHGHYDHTGGLREILHKMKKKVEIIAHPDIWQAKYHRRNNDPEEYIGIPFQREQLESLGALFKLTREPVKITDKIWTTGEVPMITGYETIDSGLFIKQDSVLKPDPVMDDQAVILNTNNGLVIVLGCAHRGMINTIYHAQKISGVNEIRAVIGGSHLIGSTEERLWQTITALHELGVAKLGLCHCTDLPAISILAQEFGEGFIFNKCGSVMELA